ncbi:hypothetical protein GCM10027037_35740 [Mucilaginibacter koreensis]
METEIPLQIIDLHEDGFHPLVEVVVYGQAFKVVLDTGASKSAFDQTMLLQANSETSITVTERLSTGLGTNSMNSSLAILPIFSIGNLGLTDFEVAVLDLSNINIAYQQLNHPQVLGVLGGDILMKYSAVIDYGKQTLMLKWEASF